MGISTHALTAITSLALGASTLLASASCDRGGPPGPEPLELEIRFHDSAARGAGAAPQLALTGARPDPTRYDDVARILVDISYASDGRPYYVGFELAEDTPGHWHGSVPDLDRDTQLRFFARALAADGTLAFSGETLATLTEDEAGVEIPLAPAQDGQTFAIPRLFRLLYPARIYAHEDAAFVFTIEGQASSSIDVKIRPAGGTAAAPEFSPATGTFTLGGTVADYVAAYTPPAVTTETTRDYEVTLTAAAAQSIVVVTTSFPVTVLPSAPGAAPVAGTTPTVRFSPVVLSLTADGSDTPGAVSLLAEVHDDSPEAELAYHWSYQPDPGTDDATFANGGAGNPGELEDYTINHQGTIALAVTDPDGGTTTLRYQLKTGQFSEVIDHGPTKGIAQLVSGNAHNCVLTTAGRVRCWGDNAYGQLGYGNTTDVGDSQARLPRSAGDVPLPTTDPAIQLAAGRDFTCALLRSGHFYCWGYDAYGQLGYGRTDNLGDNEPVTAFGYVTLGGLAKRIAAGGEHACALMQSGALRCWGRNTDGQLGRGNTVTIGDDEQVYAAGDLDLGAGVIVKDLALGAAHTCVLLTTGAVRCWGRGAEGQLGYGSPTNIGHNAPINYLPNIALTGPVRKLVAGGNHTCALTTAGKLRCWGAGGSGQLGQLSGSTSWGDDAGETPATLPGDVDTGATVTDVRAGSEHTCALSSDARLKCWGNNYLGQLGTGGSGNQSTPPTAGINLDGITATRVSAGTNHTCALRANGTVRCWGYGGDGRLGRGSTSSSSTATGAVDVQVLDP